jgi:hypothetical protein
VKKPALKSGTGVKIGPVLLQLYCSVCLSEHRAMKLVVLYGPPSTGRLMVARELSRLTGLRLFHNHLTVD